MHAAPNPCKSWGILQLGIWGRGSPLPGSWTSSVELQGGGRLEQGILELDLVIIVGPFQIRTFYDSMNCSGCCVELHF